MVRCKFKLSSKKLFAKNDQCERPVEVDMYAVTGEPFGKYTPSGQIKMYIQNDAAEVEFELGEEYYVDIYKVS